jgi:hypothetical protein
MGIFKNKKSDLTAGPDIPLDQINAMKNQGYSNNQIIQTLQRDGYTSSQIFDAMSQTEMNASAPAASAVDTLRNQLPTEGMQPLQQQIPLAQGNASEEMIEAIIDEKWNELVRDINKIIEWKQKADTKIITIEQQMNDLKDQFDKLHQAIISKINDYDKHIVDVGAELQAMEKTFSKVLPTFVDNVSELSRIADKMKTPPAKQVKQS